MNREREKQGDRGRQGYVHVYSASEHQNKRKNEKTTPHDNHGVGTDGRKEGKMKEKKG